MEHADKYLFAEPETLEDAQQAIQALSAALLRARLERDNAKQRDAFMPAMFNKLTIKRFMYERVAQNAPFGVFLIDLDNFKAINDSLGHSVGDKVLLRFGELIGEAFRRVTDTVALGRIGGDEFVIVVDMETGGRRETDLTAQMDKVYRHLREVEAQFLADDPRLGLLHVGFSIGSALYDPDHPVPADMLYDQADEAMYEEKPHGIR